MLYDKSKFEEAYNNPKLYFIYKEIEKIKNIKILELGVRNGISTSMFLKLCEENDGKMISVDVVDCSHLYQNNRWKFIHDSDDNFEKINNEIKDMGGLDVVYIDSFHEANHIKKILALSLYAKKNKTLLSKKIETDILLRFACTTQISQAIKVAGRKPKNDFVIIGIGKKSTLDKLHSDLISYLNPQPLSKNNHEFLKKQFKISKKQMSTLSSSDPLEDILVEKAAVLF